MYVIREVMQCKPGKVRDMVQRFKKLNAIAPRLGLKPSQILTDVSGEHFWTVVGTTEVESLEAFFASMEMIRRIGASSLVSRYILPSMMSAGSQVPVNPPKRVLASPSFSRSITTTSVSTALPRTTVITRNRPS